MLQSTAGARIHAARHSGNAPVHQLSLRFEPGQLRVERQDPPWKVVRAFPQENGSLLTHLHNVSGGILAGDRLALRIEVAAGARAQVTTTGATRLYRHRPGSADSQQVIEIDVGEDALLEYLPDPIIPYAGSRHSQRTEIRLARGAALFWWEVLAPGRRASGEHFAFDHLRIATRIANAEREVLRENFALNPRLKPLAVAARMHGHGWLTSLNICQEGREAWFWRGLEDRLNETARERSQAGEAVWGASAFVSDGVAVRGLSSSALPIHAALTDFWRMARRAVTGSEGIPPRKLY